MTSEPIDACGIRVANAIDERAIDVERVGPPHRGEHLAGGVLQRQMKVRREARRRATRSTSSRLQSIGSSELNRNSTSPGHAASRATSDSSEVPSPRSRP